MSPRPVSSPLPPPVASLLHVSLTPDSGGVASTVIPIKPNEVSLSNAEDTMNQGAGHGPREGHATKASALSPMAVVVPETRLPPPSSTAVMPVLDRLPSAPLFPRSGLSSSLTLVDGSCSPRSTSSSSSSPVGRKVKSALSPPSPHRGGREPTKDEPLQGVASKAEINGDVRDETGKVTKGWRGVGFARQMWERRASIDPQQKAPSGVVGKEMRRNSKEGRRRPERRPSAELSSGSGVAKMKVCFA